MLIKNGVILVGGKGTRLKDILEGKPKPLVPILGIPLLEYQVNTLIINGVETIYFLADYKSELIEQFIETRFPTLKYLILKDGDKPLGNGGALLQHIEKLPSQFFLLYGDTFFDIDLLSLSEFHSRNNSDLTLFTHPNSHPYDSDLILLGENNKIEKIQPYPHPNNFFSSNLVNAALYAVNKSCLIELKVKKGETYDFAKDIIPILIENSKKIYSYKSKEYIKDCGTPKRLLKVEQDVTSGKVISLKKKQKTPTIFLDRDGTLIENVPHLNSISQIKFIPNTHRAIQMLNDAGFLSVLITNQPVISRGELSIKGLKRIHEFIEWELGKSGAYLDSIKYCPHHPEKGFEGEIKELKIDCNCRKPKTGLFEQTDDELNIDKSRSWMIGDSTADIEAGKVFGVKTILVKTGFAGNDMKYSAESDFQMEDLPTAINFILDDYDKIIDKIKEANINWKVNTIFISGISCSGKSTYASCIKHYISEKLGRKSFVISLDSFMRIRKNRGEFPDIYEFNKITELLERRRNKKRITFNLKKYNYKNGAQVEFHKESHNINPNDFLIIEGLLASDFAIKNQFKENLFFLDTPEYLTFTRFKSKYTYRNLEEEQILKLYLEREFERKNILKQKVKSTIL